jgi:Flp pilus assembly protein TadD
MARFNAFIADHADVMPLALLPSWMLRRMARILLQGRRFADADRVLARMLARRPGDREALVMQGLCATQSGSHVEALRRWTKARRIDPGLVMAWCGIASSARLIGDHGRARSTITEALRLFPDDLVVACEAARVLEPWYAYEEAVALWRRVCQSPLVNPEHYQSLIQCLVAAERREEAEEAIDQALALYPDLPGFRAQRAYLALHRRDFDAAAEILRDYRSRFPDDETGIRLRDELARASSDASA